MPDRINNEPRKYMNTIKLSIVILSALIEGLERDRTQSIPEGVVYSAMMSTVSLDQFESAMQILIVSGLVTRDGSHQIRVMDPAFEAHDEAKRDRFNRNRVNP